MIDEKTRLNFDLSPVCVSVFERIEETVCVGLWFSKLYDKPECYIILSY